MIILSDEDKVIALQTVARLMRDKPIPMYVSAILEAAKGMGITAQVLYNNSGKIFEIPLGSLRATKRLLGERF
jgi:hypothetical protein